MKTAIQKYGFIIVNAIAFVGVLILLDMLGILNIV